MVQPVQGMHTAIARRWFGILGPAVDPVRRIHDASVDAAYGAVRVGTALVGFGLDARARRRASSSSVEAVLNGLWGDTLGRHEGRLAITMGVRDREGVPVPAEEASTAFPAATGRLVVLVHGLMETERGWEGSEASSGLLGPLEDDPTLTPIAIRYNTGLRVSENGARLADLLADLHDYWPVEVESISLVGRSMGGLVIRSACATAQVAGMRWVDLVDDVVTLGTPHRGAPLEKLVNVVAWSLGLVSETRPLGEYLNTRSGGIKDLRFGAVAESDWRDFEPDALLHNTVGKHPLAPGIRHHFVTGVITSNPGHPIGLMLGDLIVRSSSAGDNRHLSPSSVVAVGRVAHGSLIDSPVVVDRVMRWLTGDPASIED